MSPRRAAVQEAQRADASASPARITTNEFALISNLARKEFGLELGPDKVELVMARLGKIILQLRFQHFHDYYLYLLADSTGAALIDLIDALTTHHTGFFREASHFDFLRERVIPEWRGKGRFNIWSAACSTGEEPYSIALVARERLTTLGAKTGDMPLILATDISTRVLEAGQRGLYRADRFGSTLAPWLRKHLLIGEGRWEGWYRIKPQISAMVTFRRMNLIGLPPAESLPRFAAIFCRNVMIYFSRETQERVVNDLVACLEPGGYLMVGHSESLTGIKHSLEAVRPAVYRKR